jgi:hypothetical protein
LIQASGTPNPHVLILGESGMRQRLMRPLEDVHAQIEGQQAGAADLQAVVEDRHTDRPTGNGVIPVTQGIDQRLPQSQGWK